MIKETYRFGWRKRGGGSNLTFLQINQNQHASCGTVLGQPCQIFLMKSFYEYGCQNIAKYLCFLLYERIQHIARTKDLQ